MNRKHHSGVFMMEMIAVVFFFILCAGICIQTFVRADSMSRRASDINQSVLIAQSVAEIFKAEGTEGLKERMRAEEKEPGRFYMSFDRNGSPDHEDAEVFTAWFLVTRPGNGEITVSRNGDGLFKLSVKRSEK